MIHTHCEHCNAQLRADRHYIRYCSYECKQADLPPAERMTTIPVSEAEMLDLCVVIAGRKADLLQAHRERDLEEWERRLWANLCSTEEKMDRALMRLNSQGLGNDSRLRLLEGGKRGQED